MRRQAIAAVAVAASVVGGGVQAAGREGGGSIRSAPDVILGEVEFGAPENGARFWRIPLAQGDLLTIDLSNEALSGRDRPIRFCLLAPNVNDVRLRRSECAWERTLTRGGTYQLRFSAPSGGRWTLGAVSSTCPSFQACATAGGTHPFVYEFTAHVRAFTRIVLRGPRIVNARARMALTGDVTGVDGGHVELQAALGGAPWRSAATVRLKPNGTFTWTTRAAASPGRHRIRALYPGDVGHLPSRAVHTYRVAG